MRLRQYLRGFGKWFRNGRPGRRPPSRRPTVEALEVRTVPTATLDLSTGIVNVNAEYGTTSNDVITINRMDGPILRANDQPDHFVTVTINGVLTKFYREQVRQITIDNAPGNDTVNIENDYGVHVVVDAGDGTNTVNVSPTYKRLVDSVTGSLYIIGGDHGFTKVNLDDDNDGNIFNHYTLYSNHLVRGSFPDIVYTNVNAVNFSAGALDAAGDGTINVESTAANENVTVHAPANRPVRVSGVAGNLGNIAGPLTVYGGRVTINDQWDPQGIIAIAPNAVEVPTPGSFALTARVSFYYAASVEVDASLLYSLNAIEVDGTAAGTPLTLDTGASPGIDLGPSQLGANTSLDSFQASLNLVGPTANSHVNLFVNDRASLPSKSYTWAISSGSIQRIGTSGTVTIKYSNLADVVVNAGAANDSFVVDDVFVGGANQPVLGLAAGGGTNQLQGPDVPDQWYLSFTAGEGNFLNSNSSVLPDTFFGMTKLVGGSAADTFHVKSSAALTGSLDGGRGTNALDYSALTAGVTVNLLLGTASGFAGGVAHIQNVTGGQGNNVLVGDANPNVLIGGPGRDLIIGGGGADTLNGGAGEDILVGAGTTLDRNLAALAAVMAEWARTDEAYAARVSHIAGGGGRNGATVLSLAQVVEDGAVDILTGGADTDWFFVGPNDVITDGIVRGERRN